MSTFAFRSYVRMNHVGNLGLGRSIPELLQKGTLLETSTAGDTRVSSYDFDADGLADVKRFESLDETGKVVSQSLSQLTSSDSGWVSVGASDADADGRIDSFWRSTQAGGYSVDDFDGDGRADFQAEYRVAQSGEVSSTASWTDSDHDGQADLEVQGRRGRSTDAFGAVPAFDGVGPAVLGGELSALVPADARQISWSEGKDFQTRSWDVNGDWAADFREIDQLDEQREVVARSVSFAPSADGQSGPQVLGASDSDADGRIDTLDWQTSEGQVTVADTDEDGRLELETLSRSDGSGQALEDHDHDGAVDWVSTWTRL